MLSLAKVLVVRSSSVHRQTNFWSSTGKGIDAELNGFKFGLRASIHRAEWNSAVHHAPKYIYPSIIISLENASKSIHFSCPEGGVIHKARCKFSGFRG